MLMILATVALCALFGAFLLITRVNKPGNAKVTVEKPDVKALKTYKRGEVCMHNKRTDCWIIIKDKVYDVTSYVEEHPGGDAILAHAGDDSTQGFFGPQHATRVFDMIEDFFIGDLEL